MRRMIYVLLFVVVLSLGMTAFAAEPHYHQLKSGDTLNKLADMYQTTVAEILDFNPKLSPINLKIGEKVLLPVKPVWSYHVVQPGDNVKSLADSYQVPLETLQIVNGLENNTLVEGEMIRIPIHFYLGETKNIKHQVEIGDTLFELALKYKVTLKELMEWNNLEDQDSILAGQTLVVG